MYERRSACDVTRRATPIVRASRGDDGGGVMALHAVTTG
jgi:hypothetical protein